MHHTTLTLRPMDPFAPATSWMHPDDTRTKDDSGGRIPNGLVYRFYNANQDLLYIGKTTSNLTYPVRWTGHRKAPWWPLVAFYAVDRVTGEDPELLALESAAIRAERPRFNRQHNTPSSVPLMIFAHEGPRSFVEQVRAQMPPENFAALVAAFKAEPDGSANPSSTH